jgi:hypothetical protein
MQSAVLPSTDSSMRIASFNQGNKQDMLHPQQHAGLPRSSTHKAGTRPFMDKASTQAFTQGNRQVPSLESRPPSNAGKLPSMMPQIRNNADRLYAGAQPAVCGAVEVWRGCETHKSTSSGSLGYWLRCNGTNLHRHQTSIPENYI